MTLFEEGKKMSKSIRVFCYNKNKKYRGRLYKVSLNSVHGYYSVYINDTYVGYSFTLDNCKRVAVKYLKELRRVCI